MHPIGHLGIPTIGNITFQQKTANQMGNSLKFPCILCILCTASAFITPSSSFSRAKARVSTDLRAFASLSMDEDPEQIERKGFGYPGLMQSGKVSPLRSVPSSILRPDYSLERPLVPVKKSKQEIEIMKETARIAR